MSTIAILLGGMVGFLTAALGYWWWDWSLATAGVVWLLSGPLSALLVMGAALWPKSRSENKAVIQ